VFYFGSQHNTSGVPDAPFSNWETSVLKVIPA
jgi:hypothetical protein